MKQLETMLKDLSQAIGIGNAYEDIQGKIQEYLPQKNRGVIQKNGNLIYEVQTEKEEKRSILLDAHMDEIGFIVTFITKEGFLKISPVGGADTRLLLSQRMVVLGKKRVQGVISAVAPHLKTSGEEGALLEITQLYLDVGMDYDTALNYISLGDFVTFHVEAANLLGEEITGKSLDNRVGCATVLYVLHRLKEKPLNHVKITGLFSVKEEINGEGAIVAGRTLSFDSCIGIDVSFAKVPSVPSHQCGEMRKGPMIGISPILDRPFGQKLMALSEKKNIPYQREVMSGRTSTNGDHISISKFGIPTALLSIPIKNMHSPIEVVDLGDIRKTGELILEYLWEVDCELS